MKRHREIHPGWFLAAILIAVVATISFITLTSVDAAQRVCPPGEVFNERSGACVAVDPDTPTPRPTSVPRPIATDIPIESTAMPRSTSVPVEPTNEPVFPTDEPDEPVAEPTEPSDQMVAPQAIDEDSSTVRINKYLCSEALLIVNDISDCARQPGVTFNVSHGGEVVSGVSADTTLVIDGLMPGPMVIEEAQSSAFHPFRFTCWWSRQENGQVVEAGTESLKPESGNIWSVDFSASDLPGVIVACDVYNVPTDEFIGISIRKILCDQPRSTFENMSLDEFFQAISNVGVCSLDMPNVEFSVDDGSGEQILVTDDDGLAIWDTNTSNFASITESVPNGYDVPKVICTEGGLDNAFEMMPDGASITLNMETHPNLGCFWYNFPLDATSGQVLITKYTCSGSTFTDATDCGHAPDGIEISLAQSGSVVITGVTDPFGQISVLGLSPGNYEIVEPSGGPCAVEADPPMVNGAIVVSSGELTSVLVFNCEIPPDPEDGTPADDGDDGSSETQGDPDATAAPGVVTLPSTGTAAHDSPAISWLLIIVVTCALLLTLPWFQVKKHR